MVVKAAYRDDIKCTEQDTHGSGSTKQQHQSAVVLLLFVHQIMYHKG